MPRSDSENAIWANIYRVYAERWPALDKRFETLQTDKHRAEWLKDAALFVARILDDADTREYVERAANLRSDMLVESFGRNPAARNEAAASARMILNPQNIECIRRGIAPIPMRKRFMPEADAENLDIEGPPELTEWGRVLQQALRETEDPASRALADEWAVILETYKRHHPKGDVYGLRLEEYTAALMDNDNRGEVLPFQGTDARKVHQALTAIGRATDSRGQERYCMPERNARELNARVQDACSDLIGRMKGNRELLLRYFAPVEIAQWLDMLANCRKYAGLAGARDADEWQRVARKVAKIVCDLDPMRGNPTIENFSWRLLGIMKKLTELHQLASVGHTQSTPALLEASPTQRPADQLATADLVGAIPAENRGNDESASPSTTAADGQGGAQIAQTANEAVQMLGDEWATYNHLSSVTGKTESAIRGRVSRAMGNGKLMSKEVQDIPDRRPGGPQKRLRIRAVWPHI